MVHARLVVRIMDKSLGDQSVNLFMRRFIIAIKIYLKVSPLVYIWLYYLLISKCTPYPCEVAYLVKPLPSFDILPYFLFHSLKKHPELSAKGTSSRLLIRGLYISTHHLVHGDTKIRIYLLFGKLFLLFNVLLHLFFKFQRDFLLGLVLYDLRALLDALRILLQRLLDVVHKPLVRR